jgi:hydroxymethylbilane synthase
MLPAVGQGALGIEARTGDAETRAILAQLDHAATHQAVLAERSLLFALRGGCLAPVGAWGRIDQGQLRLDAVVLSGNGSQKVVAAGSANPEDGETLGQRVANDLIQQGAAELIAAAREGGPDPAIS